MEHMKLAIVTDDGAYGKALARALLIGDRTMDLSLLSCGTFCERWHAGGQAFRESFDLILWDQEGIERIYGGNLVRLSERAAEAGEGAGRGDRFTIDKYSPSAAMLAQIYQVYEKLTGRRPAAGRPDRVDVFTFVSWQGGCGCTTLAMALAQELSRFEGKRVLYLSFEGTESSPLYMKMPAGMRTAGEYLYHLTADEGRLPFAEEYFVRDPYGTELFAASPGANPLSMAEPEEIDLLLPALLGSGRFDCIVIDAGTGTGAQMQRILPYADRIILVSSREEPQREMRHRAFLGCESGASFPEKLVRVRNRCHAQPGRSESGEDPGGMPQISVREWPAAGPPLMLEGGFGKDIHELAQLCYNKVK